MGSNVNEEYYRYSRGNIDTCRETCAYCDQRRGEGPIWPRGGRPAARCCTRTESELIYRRPNGPTIRVSVTADGRLEFVVEFRDRGSDPWSPAALLRAAFADRISV